MILVLATLLAADYISVDVRTREIVEQQWVDANRAIPVGSLVKPFLALAYPDDFPEFTCTGERCWLRRGHGRLRFRAALAVSCNAYFLNLARRVNPSTLQTVAAKFGIPAPDEDTAEARIGLGTAWRISPVALARAYCELASRSGEPRVREILAGLRTSAESGTASALGRGVLAKTGTAPCVSEPKDVGDGFTVVMEPADGPRRVLLVRVHGTTGAEAAKSASRILRKLK
jgi:cell division protein FtsI/penicillin-binding protein 2